MNAKQQLRAWLFELLARVERCESVEAEQKSEGDTVTLGIKFKD